MRLVVVFMLATIGLGCASDGTARPVPADAGDAATDGGLSLSDCRYMGEPNGIPRYHCHCSEPVTLLVSYGKDASGQCIEFSDGCQPDQVTRLIKKDCLGQ